MPSLEGFLLPKTLMMRYTRRSTRKEEAMRDTFLAEAQAALLALLFGDEAQANKYLDNLTREEYRALIHAAQRLSKLALERHRSYTVFPDEFPYDDLSGDARNPD
jgi:fumarate hydratase class II